MLCSDGPVKVLVELTLTAEHRRGHGAMYDVVNHGWLEPRRLRRLLASTPLPSAADGRIVLAVDMSNWLRPDAPYPARSCCSATSTGGAAARISSSPADPAPSSPRRRRDAHPGRPCWTRSGQRYHRGDRRHLRDVVTRLVHAGQRRPGDEDILVAMDSGYDVTRLAYVLADLPVELVGRLCSDRVMLRDAGPRRSTSRGGQPRKHGGVPSPSPSRPPGIPLTRPRPATPLATAGPKPSPGAGCTPDCRLVAPGSITAVNSL
ncbi:transposase [Streptomyces antibioticus]|uniref:transposase n=1 Tax=Streptomyces antibioticus TaxID=1890 RepID=UPI0036CC9C81